jgi:LuxR family transcriptional regulator, maltose regulon positive regulatory protein
LTITLDRGQESRTTLPGGHPVLESKLVPPSPRPGLIARPRLIERLEARPEVPLVVLAAPAGYGKSTALAEWARRTPRASIWLRLDERDDDPAVLLEYLAVAIDRTIGLDRAAIAAIGEVGSSVWTTAVPALGSAIAQSVTPFLLVLDDVDRLHARESLDVIVALAAHVPTGSQIAIATRSIAGLPIPRLRAADQVVLLERDDLRLDVEEATAVLHGTGPRRTPDEVRELNAAAEGWPAAISMAAMASRSGGRASNGASAMSTVRELVAEYLRTELLDRLTDREVRFLLLTAPFERLSASLCDAVLETSTSARTLDALGRTSLLLIPIDGEPHWYRHHALVREFLRDEAMHRDAQAAREVVRRASAWYEDAGDLDNALSYALAASDLDRVRRLLPEGSQRAFNAGHAETVGTWYDWLEQHERGEADPTAAWFGALFFAFVGEAGRAERWATLASRSDDGEPVTAALGRLVRSVMCRDGVDAMLHDAEAAAAGLPATHPFGPAARLLVGLARDLGGEPDAADAVLADALDLALASPFRNTATTLGLVARASLAIRRGAWATAEEHVRLAWSVVRDGRLEERIAGLAVDAVSARIAAHHGAVTQARADLAHAERLRPMLNHAIPWLAVRVRIDLAMTQLALGNPSKARELMVEVREITARRTRLGSVEDEAAAVEHQLDVVGGLMLGTAMLTIAELRLLPLLATHETFSDIARRMVLSTNTVKTQAKSIYRKLDASSRSEAVERAREFGLLESAPSTINSAAPETRPIVRPRRDASRPGFIPTG